MAANFISRSGCRGRSALLPLVGCEIEFCAGGGLELLWPLGAGKVVTDPQRIGLHLVNGRKRLAGVWALDADNCHALWFGGRVESHRSLVRLLQPLDGHLI